MRFDQGSGLWLPSPSGRVVTSRSLAGGTRHGRLVVQSAPFGHGRKGGGGAQDAFAGSPLEGFSAVNQAAIRSWSDRRRDVPRPLELQEVAGPTTPWTNEPIGNTILTDKVFNLIIPTDPFGAPDATGWAEANNQRGLGSIVTDGSAPLDSGAVFQESYPNGYIGGGAPCTYYYTHAAHKKKYVGFYWKPTNPWQNHPSSINKILFEWTSSNADCGLIMYGSSAAVLRFFTEYPSDTRGVNGTTVITLGVWHKLELRIEYATTSSSADGTATWWLDGNQEGHLTDIQTPNDSGFVQDSISPTWGGNAGTKTEDDFFWYNHLRSSFT